MVYSRNEKKSFELLCNSSFSCRSPGMTKESRHIQLTNQINFIPALCGPSNMNAFTIFIQNSSLVDNHSTKYKCYIDMDELICLILNHCLDSFCHIPPGKFLKTELTIATHEKLKLINHMRTGGLQSFKVNVRPSSLMSWNAFLYDKKRQSADNASTIVCAG